MITQSFDLNLIPNSSPVVVHCDQYDQGTGRLIISLYEGNVAYSPTGTATIQGRKPDGKGFSYNVSISGNVVTANLTEQMSAVAGQVRCQIVVVETTGRTGTFAFILDVQPSALPLDTDLSESDYQFIEQAIEAAEDAEGYSEDSEAWAVGERGGVPVDPSDETYHNNAKWWAEQSAGGATSLADLTDVTITSPTDGQSLVYDDATDKWVNGDGGASAFADLTDVAISNLANGQIPQYNSTSQKWENKNLPTIPDDINDLSDVVISSAQNGQGLIYDSTTSKWKNQNIPSGGASDLDDLGDVVISSVSNGQVLKYNSTSQKWENANESGGGASDLDDLDDVTITSPTNGQALLYDSTNQTWVNGNVSGGSGDYVGLYGMTEIQSSDGQGTTLIDLDTYTTIGNYYCNGKGKLSLNHYVYENKQSTVANVVYSDAIFTLTVKRLPNNGVTQEIMIVTSTTSYRRLIRFHSSNGWTSWSRQGSNTGYSLSLELNNLSNVTVPSPSNDDALVYSGSNSKWINKPINKVTTFAVDLTGWTSDTTSQSGTTLYKKQITLTNVYVSSPSVDIGAGTGYVLPTSAEQESYDLLQYVTCDDAVPCLYLYASAIPTTAFYIKVRGCD